MFVLGRHPGGLNTNCLAYSPDGRFLVSGRAGVRLWDLHERRLVWEAATQGHATSVSFAPGGQVVVTRGQGISVQFLEPQTGQSVREFSHSWCMAQCALFSGDGQTLICGGHSHGAGGAKVGRILRWNLKTGRQRRPLGDVPEDVGFVSLSPDGKRLAAGGDRGTAWVWNLASREVAATFPSRPGWRVVQFAPGGRGLVVTAGRNVDLYDPKTLKKRRILRGHKGKVKGIAFCPDGALLSAAEDGTVRLWNLTTCRETAAFDWQVGVINNVAASPDGLTAAVSSREGDIVVWDLEGS